MSSYFLLMLCCAKMDNSADSAKEMSHRALAVVEWPTMARREDRRKRRRGEEVVKRDK